MTCCNVAVYILVQSEKEYFLIWKIKPIAIQTDKGNGKKMTKKVQNYRAMGYCDVISN